jgi:hypothetical protein
MIKLISTLILVFLIAGICFAGQWEDYSNDQIANAIYWAEGGKATSHPYGILAHYEHTTPRQAAINTIKHARRDFKGENWLGLDFIEFLGNRYCPVGADNDPTNLNVNWVKNVKSLLLMGKEIK